MKNKVVSLFSGCGGFDFGFSQIPEFEVVSAYDKDRRAIETYNKNIKANGRVCDLARHQVIEDRADIIIAGPPCQGFSTASGNVGHDARNELLEIVVHTSDKLKPKHIIIENVSSLMNVRNQQYLDRLTTQLRQLGYFLSISILNAADFGVAQRRMRLFIFASKSSSVIKAISFEKLTTSRISVKEALSGLGETVPGHFRTASTVREEHLAIAQEIRPGQKLCNVRTGSNSVPTWAIPQVFGKTSMEEISVLEALRTLRRRSRSRKFGDADPVSEELLTSHIGQDCSNELLSLLQKGYLRQRGNQYDLAHTFNGKYRRLDPDGLSPTVDTRFGDIRLFLHPFENRGMTPREAARLQGFPDSFELPKEPATAYRQVGNAVPPPLGLAVAKALWSAINA